MKPCLQTDIWRNSYPGSLPIYRIYGLCLLFFVNKASYFFLLGTLCLHNHQWMEIAVFLQFLNAFHQVGLYSNQWSSYTTWAPNVIKVVEIS